MARNWHDHTMHKDIYLDKLTQTNCWKKKLYAFLKEENILNQPSGLHWVLFDKNSNRKNNYITICHVNSNFVTLKIKNLMMKKL